ncbi:nitrite reductase large subunit NirB [Shouchella clausii]|uniref:nitrite reductase large subunit NirB n=1 Tax=Shouchella clausii TaxID=79880 RepID=UPI0015CAF6D8|nr:nitrite reductase large subunit NirB [Shouchella clausii]MBU8595305.1 nitrite reductase large subunit NirB [Shouchella clausii]MCY1103363.1 nitrite reductase large subunit NirB [Shouchella clausii]MED4158617.1 nitrite reductase large subunit NirB [Shouchella clausii]MED4177118.1 nitrite reductase large subunit NirB [Shouchella clausii]
MGSESRQRLVFIGNGMAGVRVVEEVLKLAPRQFVITVLSEEDRPSYNRILLSSVLQGKQTLDSIDIHPFQWYVDHSIELRLSEKATRIDAVAQKVYTDKGELAYDKLVIATGSEPFVLPVPGVKKEGVFVFRTIRDCERLTEWATRYQKAAVIGGGLLGLEAAQGLAHLGIDVSVVHLSDRIMERQLDETAARLLKQSLEKKGIRFLLQKQTAEISGEEQVTGLRFQDGTTLSADFVVMAAGVQPNIAIAKKSNIPIKRGIVVDDRLRTDISGVYAVGECAEHNGISYGLVAPLYEQAKVLARELCGQPGLYYNGTVLATKLKISGVNVFSAGETTCSRSCTVLTTLNEITGQYKKLLFKGDCLAGAVLFGDTRQSDQLLQLIRANTPLSDDEKTQLLTEDGTAFERELASLPTSHLICNCNAVSKGDIMKAIAAGQHTVTKIKAGTKAASSCGGCEVRVAAMLESFKQGQLKATVDVAERKPLCPCTALTEQQVSQSIAEKRLVAFSDMSEKLGWKNKSGCRVCRKVSAYYAGLFFPEGAPKERNGKQENDGSYTITLPRIAGSLSTDQLKQFALMAEELQLPRIDFSARNQVQLKGLAEKQLPDVFEQLGMPPVVLAGKRLQVAIDDRHYSWPEGRHLAEKLLDLFNCVPFPTETEVCVTLAARRHELAAIRLSRSPLNWEVAIGSELFCTNDSVEGTFQLICALLQYFRQSARYSENIHAWLVRKGAVHVREVVFDTACQAKLNKQLAEITALNRKLAERMPVV